jgi:hypothetical protein
MMETVQAQPPESQLRHAFLKRSAAEGIRLQSALSNWKTVALTWSATSPMRTSDLQMMLATIYHHAISIYLSGTFDYFPYWDESGIPTPSIPPSQVQAHVKAILGMVATALNETNLAGILFLYYIMSLVPQFPDCQTNANNRERWSEYGRHCHVPFYGELLEIRLIEFASPRTSI